MSYFDIIPDDIKKLIMIRISYENINFFNVKLDDYFWENKLKYDTGNSTLKIQDIRDHLSFLLDNYDEIINKYLYLTKGYNISWNNDYKLYILKYKHNPSCYIGYMENPDIHLVLENVYTMILLNIISKFKNKREAEKSYISLQQLIIFSALTVAAGLILGKFLK